MARSIPKTLVVGFALLAAGIGLRWASQPKVPPPVPIARIGEVVGPLRLSPGPGGACLVLPDGSLWQWGTGHTPGVRALVPTQFGTNYDWSSASATFSGIVGIKTNGTLWRSWFQDRSGRFVPDLEPCGEDTNWVLAARNSLAIAALKRDGSLHTAGTSGTFDGTDRGALGVIGATVRYLPEPVGTNRWRTLARDGSGYGFVGITAGGRLLAWGQPFPGGPIIPMPAPLATGTQWVAAAQRLYLESNGRLWHRPLVPPSQAATNTNIRLRLVHTNAAPDRYGMSDDQFFEIRADGTLWRGPKPVFRPADANQPQPLLQITTPCGDRRDWRHIWYGHGTVYALTTDGTIWVAGTDHGVEARPTFGQRMEYYTDYLRGWIGMQPKGAGVMDRTVPRIPELRPLIRVVMPENLALRVEDGP